MQTLAVDLGWQHEDTNEDTLRGFNHKYLSLKMDLRNHHLYALENNKLGDREMARLTSLEEPG